MLCRIHLIVVICVSLAARLDVRADEASKPTGTDAAKIDFFESRIRPVLIEHCYACHANQAKEIKGGLLLDSRQGWQVGGDSGAAIVPGDPSASLLLNAVRHESLEMPPDQKLPDNVIADFSQWIRDGAADPREGEVANTRNVIDLEQGREFWSFRPVQSPLIPALADKWASTNIDRLIAAQQMVSAQKEGHKIIRAPEATPEVLIRRLSFLLTGLPPTLEAQEAFATAWAINADAAMEETVDRLLASPSFGERWGRHWLDVARFSESTGGGRSLMLPDAWRFRDYAIESFNADKPVDQLIREQIAGDLLPSSSDQEHDEHIIGSGYLMLGAINYEEQDKDQLRMDVVDEQIDSMGRTFLGMTLGCCRCHDHKFDPIPTTDYYALAGIFRSTKSLLPNNVSDFVTAPLRVGYDKVAIKAWAEHDKSLEQQIADLKKRLPKDRRVTSTSKSPSRESLAGIVVDDFEAIFDGIWVESQSVQPFIGDRYMHSGTSRTGIAAHYETTLPSDGEYLVRMAMSVGENRAESVPVLIVHADGESIVMVNQQIAPQGDGVFAELGRFRFEAAVPAKVTIKAAEASPGVVIADAIQFVDSMAAAIADAPNLEKSTGEELDSTADEQGIAKMEERLKKLEAERADHKKHKLDAPIAMCVRDEDKPADWHVHIRGEVRNFGPVVPRGFLTVATPISSNRTLSAAEAETSSGRKQLADWIASPNNPLTARVYVNRVWMHVMGEGLVRTPDNFGSTGDRPTHPEVLDYLAATFVRDHQWSTKKLVRMLCLTSAFRMSSDVSAAAHRLDPENQELTRGFRRCLDAESIRDTLLSISGSLDLSVRSGRTIANVSTYDNAYHHDENPLLCRSVYVPSFRNTMFDMFEVFDVANPNVVTGKRTHSLRPAQSLYMLNSPLVMEQSQLSADRFLQSSSFHFDELSSSVTNAWRICLGRDPSEAEMKAALEIVDVQKNQNVAWRTLFHGLFASVDFRYVD